MKTILSALLLISLGAAFPNVLYEHALTTSTTKTDCEECKGKPEGTCTLCPTNDVDLKCNALGLCTCDITLNSCDAYCDCDPDCGKQITEVW